jgi:hypothetical protein
MEFASMGDLFAQRHDQSYRQHRDAILGALAVIDDEAFNPIAVRLLRTEAVMLDPNPVANAVEQENRRGGPHRIRPFGPRMQQDSGDSANVSETAR